MNIKMGSHDFMDVEIPLLWGKRAVVQDSKGRISVIDLGTDKPTLEILGDSPAPDVEYVPLADGFQILRDGVPLYSYSPSERKLSSVELDSTSPTTTSMSRAAAFHRAPADKLGLTLVSPKYWSLEAETLVLTIWRLAS